MKRQLVSKKVTLITFYNHIITTKEYDECLFLRNMNSIIEENYTYYCKGEDYYVCKNYAFIINHSDKQIALNKLFHINIIDAESQMNKFKSWARLQEEKLNKLEKLHMKYVTTKL